MNERLRRRWNPRFPRLMTVLRLSLIPVLNVCLCCRPQFGPSPNVMAQSPAKSPTAPASNFPPSPVDHMEEMIAPEGRDVGQDRR